MGIDILGVDILGIDILGIDILAPTQSKQHVIYILMGRRGPGKPRLTWKKLAERDRCEWKLTTVDPQGRSTWRSGVRSAMRAASQLPGKGPTDVDDVPAPAR